MASISELYRTQVEQGDLRPDEDQKALIAEFERLAADLSTPVRTGLFRKTKATTKGLYIWGGVGRGKSMLMDLFVKAVANFPHRRVHFHAFMQEIHGALNEARKQGVNDALAPVIDAVAKDLRLLAFDEMQISDITDAMIVGRLFEGILARGVAVVTTSNRPPEDLYKDGLNRELFLPFISLLQERMVVWTIQGSTDYRQNRLANTQVYFSPIGPQANAEIRAVWNDLSGGRSEELILTVTGREIILPQFGNGVARATFYQLCGNPLGPGDYLEIAAAVRVLILENIPRLSRSNFNEAKRFVTLIDALYEARIRLICSADAEPEMLYVEGEGLFEFERTASRLREMQSASWGSAITP